MFFSFVTYNTRFCNKQKQCLNLPEEADVEFRIVVMAIELISSFSGDHILNIDCLQKILGLNLSLHKFLI